MIFGEEETLWKILPPKNLAAVTLLQFQIFQKKLFSHEFFIDQVLLKSFWFSQRQPWEWGRDLGPVDLSSVNSIIITHRSQGQNNPAKSYQLNL